MTAKTTRRPNTRSTLRDLKALQVIQVFRRPSFLRRLRQLFRPPAD